MVRVRHGLELNTKCSALTPRPFRSRDFETTTASVAFGAWSAPTRGYMYVPIPETVVHTPAGGGNTATRRIAYH